MARLFNSIKLDKARSDNTFHLVIAPLLTFVQLFGILPIIRVFSSNVKNIRFKFLSIRTLHSSLWLLSILVFLLMEINRLSQLEKINAKSIDGLIFYSLGITTAMVYFRIAAKWNGLMNLFKDVEGIFNSSPYVLPGWTLKKRLNVLSWTMLSLAFLEHAMSWVSYLYDKFFQVNVCGLEVDSWFNYLLGGHMTHVYKVLPIRTASVLWAEYMNISITISWNFVDLLIMILSISIATKFKMLNERINFFKGKVIPDTFWDEIRQHYIKICELNEYVDDMLGHLICIASLSDLYYVCLQLLNVSTPLPHLANKLYFWYSTVYLICRTSAMFLISASINDESIKPLTVFRTIPSEGWQQEIQRLCSQIYYNTVALSGKNFFFLTRGIVISIAGTIITYELVLLQFDGDKTLPANPCGNYTAVKNPDS